MVRSKRPFSAVQPPTPKARTRSRHDSSFPQAVDVANTQYDRRLSMMQLSLAFDELLYHTEDEGNGTLPENRLPHFSLYRRMESLLTLLDTCPPHDAQTLASPIVLCFWSPHT